MRNQLITLIVVLASAMVVSTMARAAGESKNQAPFTRQIAQAQTESRGEAKNEPPFTAGSTAVPDVFERYATAHPYGRGIVSARSNENGGVQWRYVLGGSGIGGVLLLVGLVGLQTRRRSHRVPALTA
jgi:hypothetical protein